MSYKTTHTINPSALRAYDIRGAIGDILHIEDAYYIGRAYATIIIRKTGLKNPKIAIGYDGRLTTPAIFPEVLKGMVAAGAHVYNVGLGPSPMLYYAVRSNNFDGGLMVTASHNPSHHNGFKMMYSKAPLFGADIQELGRISAEGDFESNDGGFYEPLETKQLYIARILEAISDEAKKNLSNFRIAWDAGNGAAGEITQLLAESVPGKHFLINTRIDGNFPAHHPDPTVAENLQQLISVVKENNCDLGIAFDGDGDRIGAVDSQGRIIWGDQLMTIYAEDVLEKNPGAIIIADVKASQSFFDRVTALGGKPVMWKTGHSYIKNKLAETGAKLAGEMSGHIFFNDEYYGFDDAVYSALRLINFFGRKNLKPSDVVDSLPKTFATKEHRITVPEADKVQIVENIRAKILASMPAGTVDEIDGIRVNETALTGESSWWLLRSSNTQSAVTLRAEATSAAGLKKITDKILALLAAENVNLEVLD